MFLVELLLNNLFNLIKLTKLLGIIPSSFVIVKIILIIHHKFITLFLEKERISYYEGY